MQRMKQVLWVALMAAGLAGASAFAADRTERVTLGEGTTTLKGHVTGYDSVQYSLTAQPGQQLLIRLATSNPSNYLNVERSGMAEAVCQGALTGNTCSVRAETAADYVVDVFLMRNAARRGEQAEYTLSIEHGSAQPGPSAGAARDAAAKEAAAAAVAACKSALALKSGVNAVFVLPLSHVAAAGGYEVFLSLKGAQWLCTTDPRGNVNRVEQR
ncbi:hypothetical protein [Acidovorax cavernicola]|uniref:DNA breaking-rejoining protein n=1 Tax=Acidovorax cavernicola TaxID=1675792 RepID=A0A9X8CY72_9BURK|nr:hypothetical protein [Acidovorax cavernicola]RIX71308.1 hypothetical protein D3H34_32130 [Acidovorax cavernicola]